MRYLTATRCREGDALALVLAWDFQRDKKEPNAKHQVAVTSEKVSVISFLFVSFSSTASVSRRVPRTPRTSRMRRMTPGRVGTILQGHRERSLARPVSSIPTALTQIGIHLFYIYIYVFILQNFSGSSLLLVSYFTMQQQKAAGVCLASGVLRFARPANQSRGLLPDPALYNVQLFAEGSRNMPPVPIYWSRATATEELFVLHSIRKRTKCSDGQALTMLPDIRCPISQQYRVLNLPRIIETHVLKSYVDLHVQKRMRFFFIGM